MIANLSSNDRRPTRAPVFFPDFPCSTAPPPPHDVYARALNWYAPRAAPHHRHGLLPLDRSDPRLFPGGVTPETESFSPPPDVPVGREYAEFDSRVNVKFYRHNRAAPDITITNAHSYQNQRTQSSLNIDDWISPRLPDANGPNDWKRSGRI